MGTAAEAHRPNPHDCQGQAEEETDIADFYEACIYLGFLAMKKGPPGSGVTNQSVRMKSASIPEREPPLSSADSVVHGFANKDCKHDDVGLESVGLPSLKQPTQVQAPASASMNPENLPSRTRIISSAAQVEDEASSPEPVASIIEGSLTQHQTTLTPVTSHNHPESAEPVDAHEDAHEDGVHSAEQVASSNEIGQRGGRSRRALVCPVCGGPGRNPTDS